MTKDARHRLASAMRRTAAPDAVAQLEGRLAARLDGARAKAPAGRVGPASAAVAVAAAVAAVVVASVDRPEPGDRLLRVDGAPALRADWTSAGGAAESIALADGSRLDLEANTRLSVSRLDGTQVDLSLETGAVELSIRPGGPRRWRVRTLHMVATVIGTWFRVTTGDRRSRVTVFEGEVLVESQGAEAPVVLRRGDAVELPAPRPPPVAPTPQPREELPSRTPNPTASTPPREARPPRARRPGPEAPARPTFEDRFARADAARAEGRPDESVRILEAILTDPACDPQTRGLAALELGLLHARILQEPGPARRALERALEADLPRTLRHRAQQLLRELDEETP